ncbi:MAG: type II secretion system protein [Phycisphaeraceae bacterium]|nr:type II secretion system protein [Phycisphaeraceae bacterium]
MSRTPPAPGCERTTTPMPLPDPTTRRRTGFTLVELLVVIGIIALLAGITLVATTRAFRSAEVSSTKFLMHSMSDALEQFHTDFGYYPPLLRDDFNKEMPERTVLEVQDNAGELLRQYRSFSLCSLPAYLVGVGRLEPSETTSGADRDPERHDGVAGPGFRDPGSDHSWGGARDRSKNNPKKTGRVYGPYLDLADSDSMRAAQIADLGSGNSARKDDVARIDEELDRSMPLIVDAWGTPIRYYAPTWPIKSPLNGETTLEYAPIELVDYAAVTGGFKPELDPGITSAPYFLLSAGPNKRFAGSRPSGAGGDLSLVEFEPLSVTSTNTELLNTVDTTPGSLRRMLGMIKDNIREAP